MNQAIYEYSNYRRYLREVLDGRIKLNPSYSLRSMAKNLEVAPSTLSDVLNGKKNFSQRTATKVALSLSLSKRKSRYFCALVQYDATKNDEIRSLLADSLRILNPKQRQYFELSVDQFKLVSEWFHFAILEMTYLKDFEMSSENMARSLKITTGQAQDSINLLLKLGLIETTSRFHYVKTQKRFQTQSVKPNQAIRRFHRALLTKASESLETQSPQEKIIGSETLPININDLAEADNIIEDCFEKLVMLSEKSQNKDHIYHLGIQFFKLTTGKKI